MKAVTYETLIKADWRSCLHHDESGDTISPRHLLPALMQLNSTLHYVQTCYTVSRIALSLV